MSKRKVFIAIHQLNFGGAQKALISALNAIDYNENEVTLYIRKDRLDLLPLVNKNVSKIIINKDRTRYYRKPYSVWLFAISKLNEIFKKDNSKNEIKITQYIIKKQIQFEKKHFFSDNITYDVAVSYIQGYTAKSIAENVSAKKKIMFYHDSTDSLHELHDEVMKHYDRICCVSKGAQEAVVGFYPQFADKIDCLENYVDANKVRTEAEKFVPDYPKDKLILCSCGRITPVKGFDIAVETAVMLRAENVGFKWYFVGDGVDRAKIEKLIAEKNLGDCIEITGLKDNPYPYIKNCDIYVQPSYEEAHPLSIIEAQILNKLIVATATVGGRAVVHNEKDGLVSEINAASLSEKIRLLYNNKDLQVKIKQTLAEKDYSKDYDTFCLKWKKLLEE